jgi:hypothetical protein
VDPNGQLKERGFGPRAPRHADVPREPIQAQIAIEHGHRVVLIEGPAGYGKSTFAAQDCVRDGLPTAWVNLRDSDNDAIRLRLRLERALGAIDPCFSLPETATAASQGAMTLLPLLLALPTGQPVLPTSTLCVPRPPSRSCDPWSPSGQPSGRVSPGQRNGPRASQDLAGHELLTELNARAPIERCEFGPRRPTGGG